MKALFPRTLGDALQAVLVNTAGGVTGGDRFQLDATARAGTHLTITTQAAERAYRAKAGETGSIENLLSVETGARLNWLPQETILFDRCMMRRSLTVEMAAGAQVLLVEPLVFGRAAMGERLNEASFRDRIEIRREGAPLFLDAIALDDDVTAHLSRPAIAQGAGAMVTLIFVSPEAEVWLPILRALLPDTSGASLLRDGVLAIRALASDSYSLRQYLVPILNHLTGDALPRPWMI